MNQLNAVLVLAQAAKDPEAARREVKRRRDANEIEAQAIARTTPPIELQSGAGAASEILKCAWLRVKATKALILGADV